MKNFDDDNQKKEFDIALESLRSVFSTYLHNFWSALGSALLFMGWVLTSINAREVLSQKPTSVYIITGVFIILAIGHTQIVIKFYLQSQKLLDILTQRVEKKCYQNFEISIDRLIINLIIILSLFSLDLSLVWNCVDSKSEIFKLLQYVLSTKGMPIRL